MSKIKTACAGATAFAGRHQKALIALAVLAVAAVAALALRGRAGRRAALPAARVLSGWASRNPSTENSGGRTLTIRKLWHTM